MRMSLQEFKESVNDGKFFTVEFRKRTDGTVRTMNCRRGVSKGVKGVGMSYDPAKKNLLVVYEIVAGKEENHFRMVNLEDLIYLKHDGREWTWNAVHECFYPVAA